MHLTHCVYLIAPAEPSEAPLCSYCVGRSKGNPSGGGNQFQAKNITSQDAVCCSVMVRGKTQFHPPGSRLKTKSQAKGVVEVHQIQHGVQINHHPPSSLILPLVQCISIVTVTPSHAMIVYNRHVTHGSDRTRRRKRRIPDGYNSLPLCQK